MSSNNGNEKNQTFCHGIYSNLTSKKNYTFFNFLNKVNLNNGNETKSEIFDWDISRSDIIYHWS